MLRKEIKRCLCKTCTILRKNDFYIFYEETKEAELFSPLICSPLHCLSFSPARYFPRIIFVTWFTALQPNPERKCQCWMSYKNIDSHFYVTVQPKTVQLDTTLYERKFHRVDEIRDARKIRANVAHRNSR